MRGGPGARPRGGIEEMDRGGAAVLFPLTGATLRSAVLVPEQFGGVALRGAGLAFSSVKNTEEGDGLVLRCVNFLDQSVDGEWAVNVKRRISEAHRARLDETPLQRLELSENRVHFRAAPREVVTIIVR